MQDEANSHSSSDEFLAQVKAVAQAEAQASERLARTQKEASHIHAEAQAQALEIINKAAERAVEEKNRIIAQGRKSADAKLKKKLEEAQKISENLSSRRLSESAIRMICERI